MPITKKDRMLRQIIRISRIVDRTNFGWYSEVKKELDHLVAIIVGESKNADDDIRREVTGRSTKSSKGVFGNSGFGGGCTPMAIYA